MNTADLFQVYEALIKGAQEKAGHLDGKTRQTRKQPCRIRVVAPRLLNSVLEHVAVPQIGAGRPSRCSKRVSCSVCSSAACSHTKERVCCLMRLIGNPSVWDPCWGSTKVSAQYLVMTWPLLAVWTQISRLHACLPMICKASLQLQQNEHKDHATPSTGKAKCTHLMKCSL